LRAIGIYTTSSHLIMRATGSTTSGEKFDRLNTQTRS
jgi:hypothetical protein